MTDEEKEAFHRTFAFLFSLGIGEPQRQGFCQLVNRSPTGCPLPLVFSVDALNKRVSA